MSENIYVILGITDLSNDLSFINRFKPDKIVVSDSVNFLTLSNKTNIEIVDTCLPSLLEFNSFYDLDTFVEDRNLIENISNLIGYSNNSDISKALKFFECFILVELAKILNFLNCHQESNIIIATTNEYKILLDLLLAKGKKYHFYIRNVSLLNFFTYFRQSHNISHYGRLSLFGYSLAYPLKILIEYLFNDNKIKLDQKKYYNLVSDTNYSKQISSYVDPRVPQQSLEKFCLIPLGFILTNYFRCKRLSNYDISNNFALTRILKLFPFLNFTVRNIYSPYLYILKKYLVLEFKKYSINSIIQENDSAPHRNIIVNSANISNINTIITYRHDIPEPLMLTDVKSNQVITASEGFYKYANATNYSNHNHQHSFVLDCSDDNISFLKENTIKIKNKYIYILTNGYTGQSLRTSLVDNINLIRKTVSIAEKYGVTDNLIIKVHPCESISLYKQFFPSIIISKEDISCIVSSVNRAIVTTTSALFKLGNDVLINYNSFGERPIQFPYNYIYSIEDIIIDSVNNQ